jgi:CRP-like cAMP-binding protein
MSEMLRNHVAKRIQITDEEWKEFFALFTPHKLKKREFLTRPGEVNEATAYIVSGCLRTFYTDGRGHEHTMQIGFEDWWAGDLLGFITGAPAHYSVEALEDTQLLLLNRSDQEAFYSKHLKFEKYFRILLQSAYVASQMRMISTMSKSAEERYIELVQKYPHMELRVAQHHIASYLGITPEALSRIKRSIIEKTRSERAKG